MVATTKGAVDELIADRGGPWAGQPWDLAESIRERLALTGPTDTVSAACASGTLAIIHAVHRLLSGQAPVALVVLKPDAAVSAQELRRFCRGRLANFKVPREVHFRDALPKGGTGKILKAELREPFWKGLDARVH